MDKVEYKCPSCGGTDFEYEANLNECGDYILDHTFCNGCKNDIVATFTLTEIRLDE